MSALQGVLKDQVVAEEVLLTALIEVEGLLNSKPLGYASSDVADPDPGPHHAKTAANGAPFKYQIDS